MIRMGVRDRPSFRRRSGGRELEAACPRGRWGGWEQPRRSRDGPGLPDGPGAVSETRRYTRETGVVTPPEVPPARTRWIWAGLRCVPGRESAGGELLAGSCRSGLGGHGEGLRRSRDDAAGVEPGASLVDRIPVNVGTARSRSRPRLRPGGEGGIGTTPAEGAGGAEPS